MDIKRTEEEDEKTISDLRVDGYNNRLSAYAVKMIEDYRWEIYGKSENQKSEIFNNRKLFDIVDAIANQIYYNVYDEEKKTFRLLSLGVYQAALAKCKYIETGETFHIPVNCLRVFKDKKE